MTLIPYAEVIALSKDEKAKRLVPARVKSQKKKCELEVSKLEERIAALEGEVTEACSVHELNIHAIADKLDELALAERKLGQLTDIVNQLFPTTA